MNWHEITGVVLIAVGLLFIMTGMYGLVRYENLGTRLVIATKVDTVGLMTVLTGAVFYSGLNQHSAKIILLIGFALITNPIIAHAIAHSAWSSDFDLIGEKKPEEQEDA